MSELAVKGNDKSILRVITIISVIVPLLVVLLLVLPYKLNLPPEFVGALPHINAVINSITAVLLVLAFVFVMKGNVQLHKKTMLAAVSLGALFLLSYVLYHSSAPSTKYGDVNGDLIVDSVEKAAVASTSGFYYFVLISHIILAAVVLPFVLLAVYFALSGKIKNHKKIVRWAFPIWLYVSLTGVVVYLMIRQYYP